jgi:hypothetical protein
VSNNLVFNQSHFLFLFCFLNGDMGDFFFRFVLHYITIGESVQNRSIGALRYARAKIQKILIGFSFNQRWTATRNLHSDK